MMPDKVVSSRAIVAPFLIPDDRDYQPLIDFEYGGIALRDPSQGLTYQIWEARLAGNDVIVSAPEVADTVLFTRAGITELSLTFDQNMNPCVAFMAADQLTLWWFDTLSSSQVFTDFSGESPRVSLDDKRQTQRGVSDIILAYMRAGNLYFRAQRDRFTIETFLSAIDPRYAFKKMGMNSQNRLQFQFDPIPIVAEA